MINGTFTSRLLTWISAAWLLVAMATGAQTVSRLSTRFLARGEQALLEIAVAGNQPPELPTLPKMKDMEIQLAGRGSVRAIPGRKLEYVFDFLVSSYEMGNHVLPSFEVIVGGNPTRTEPIEFTVFNPDDLQWSEAEAGGRRFRYASTFRVLNKNPYNGETTPVEIKIYIPQEQLVEDWGNPDFQRDGVTAWRFQPSAMRGQVNLLGRPYFSVAYPSTLTPTRTGRIGIGPATVRLVTTQVVLDGFQRRVSEEVNLQVPKLELESKPLPKGAPEGFENAVGNFHIAVGTATTEVMEGDPIAVDIVVRGSGNLDTLRPPKPLVTDGWKVYEATTDQRGDERRELSGTTVFHQFMRPLEIKPEIPAFRLVYYDPKSQSYQTQLTEPIQLQMKPAIASSGAAVAPPKALPIPVERMTDILGILPTAGPSLPATRPLPDWSVHLLGALIALGLILKALWMRHGYRFRRDPVLNARVTALREVERMKSADDTGFLMAAGRFIEKSLGERKTPEVRAILAERDAVCFLMEKPNTGLLEPKRREAILRILRNAAMSCIAFILLDRQTANAVDTETRIHSAREAYDAAKYDEAITQWLAEGPYDALSPDTLYNIGNACYRAGAPGHAALYYRRAISRDSGHQEARQNLRFIDRKYGSITVHRPDYQHALARISLGAWKNITWTGAWLCGLAILVFPATRQGARIRLAAILAMVTGPLLITCGVLGWRYFPSDAEFAPLHRQGVITGEKTIVHVDASRSSPEVIDAPPGSLCEIVRESGRWVYISFATKTCGWVTAESVERIIHTSPPAPPRIRKPKADGKSA
jgi:hypothetical protein